MCVFMNRMLRVFRNGTAIRAVVTGFSFVRLSCTVLACSKLFGTVHLQYGLFWPRVSSGTTGFRRLNTPIPLAILSLFGSTLLTRPGQVGPTRTSLFRREDTKKNAGHAVL